MSDKPTPSKADEWKGSKASKFDKYATATIASQIEYFDPCQEAADKSIKCLKRNGARSKERSEKEQVMVWLSNAGEIWDAQMYNISSLHGHGV
ncbi:Mitochondrial copper homeostasis protein [Alternaria conjuncta]|uniref:Mitochondrial copper homeostasis protein n=1 Tax=Alternaria conjuncta TaxID=181017 RepID=UPI0022206975|nr:Mitochondrial copper homeostasis protein [Alternaria conjuncta]KAI4928618.1 Mitochondrial copper homeostasis protein [Alternaria conjuncta]